MSLFYSDLYNWNQEKIQPLIQIEPEDYHTLEGYIYQSLIICWLLSQGIMTGVDRPTLAMKPLTISQKKLLTCR